MYGLEDILIIMLAVGGFLITLFAQININSNYPKYKKISNVKKITGSEAARLILDKNGLNNIYVVEVKGELTDHYDPTRKVIRLSRDIFHGDSIASVSVAAHECGHAIQDKVGYSFMRLRSSLVPIVNLVSYLGYFVMVISLFMGYIGYLKVGIAMLVATLIFQLVTLPVEFDASKRALEELKQLGLVNDDELDGSRLMLKSAALTYVASLISTILNILRLVLMFNDRED